MPQGHNKHPNKRVKVEERAMRSARKGGRTVDYGKESNAWYPLSNAEITKIDNIIKNIVGDFPDTVQDVWVKVLEDGITSETEISELARNMNFKAAYDNKVEQSRSLSLNKPLGDTEGNFTLEDLIEGDISDAGNDDRETRVLSVNSSESRYEPYDPHGSIVRNGLQVLCKFCSSTNCRKYGTYKGIQRYYCKACGRKFALNGAPPKMQYPSYLIQESTRLRLQGFSLNQIRRRLWGMYKVTVGVTTMLHWFKKTGVEPNRRGRRWRKDFESLVTALGTLSTLEVYSAATIRNVCGYKGTSKIEDTQIGKRGLVERVNGGWRVTGVING